MGFFSGLKTIGRETRTVEHGAEDLGALARAAERAEDTVSDAGKVGEKIEEATEDITEGGKKGWQAIKKAGAGVTAAATTAYSAFQLLAVTRIADDINEIFNSPHAAEIVSGIFGIVVVIVGYLIFKKFSSGAKKVGELATSAKKSGGGVKKLSDTVCFFILISFIFIINFLYEKYFELEKEKEKINQLDYQSTQNY